MKLAMMSLKCAVEVMVITVLWFQLELTAGIEPEHYQPQCQQHQLHLMQIRFVCQRSNYFKVNSKF